MTTVNSILSVEKFNGKGSFTLWQRRVKDILIQQGLAGALKGEDGRPPKMEDHTWDELKSKCVSTIRLCIADNIINNVMDEDSAPNIWKKLEKLYMAKSLTNKLHLKRQLYRLKMEDGADLIEHMNVFNGILDQLQKVDVKVEEEDKALLLLTSLPDSYDNLVTTLLYGKDTVNLEQVQAVLLSHNIQKKQNLDEEGHGNALVVRADNREGKLGKGSRCNRSRPKDQRQGVQCYKCKEFGHIKRNCPHRNKKDDDNSLVVVGDGEVLTVSKDGDTISHEWILDSACVLHACFKREYFLSLQERKSGVISLGDGSTCDVKGVGTVKIKMFDGAERAFDSVAYVPRLKKNLISLSLLDSMGYRYSAGDGAMTVKQGHRVLMKGEKYQGLYRLVGSTIISKTSTDKSNVCTLAADDGKEKIPVGWEARWRVPSSIN